MGRFQAGSRYTDGVISVNRNGDQFLVLRNTLVLPPDNDDTFLTVTDEMINRPDLISYIAYQRPDLWWAICDVNSIKDPFNIVINQRLRLPDISKLLAAIETLNSNL